MDLVFCPYLSGMDTRIFVANILCCNELNRKVRSLKCFFRASSSAELSAETTGQQAMAICTAST